MREHPPFMVGGDGQLAKFKQHKVFEIRVLEGSGVQEDPFRHVTYWVLPDGRLLVRLDPRPAVEAAERDA
jgi:hypothetical protein